MSDIEAEIERTRTRLASTIDQLAEKADPKAIAGKQIEQAKHKAVSTFVSDAGEVQRDKVAIVAGVGAALLIIGILRRALR